MLEADFAFLLEITVEVVAVETVAAVVAVAVIPILRARYFTCMILFKSSKQPCERGCIAK